MKKIAIGFIGIIIIVLFAIGFMSVGGTKKLNLNHKNEVGTEHVFYDENRRYLHIFSIESNVETKEKIEQEFEIEKEKNMELLINDNSLNQDIVMEVCDDSGKRIVKKEVKEHDGNKKKWIGNLIEGKYKLYIYLEKDTKGVLELEWGETKHNINISKVKNIGSKIAKNELFIASENTYLTFYKNFTHIPSFKIDCLSSNEIDTKEVKAKLDIDTPYRISITKLEIEEFDLYSFKLFSGYDKKRANKLKEKDEDAYNQYEKKFSDAYNQLSEDEVGKLYHYVITISFDLENAVHTETFNKIQLEYDGKKVSKDIGKIVIDCEQKNIKKEKSLYTTCPAMKDIALVNNAKGSMEVTNSNLFETKKAVVLNNIYFLNKESKMQSCSVSIQSLKGKDDINWKGKSIKVNPNSKLGLDIFLHRDDFNDKAYYQCNDYLVMEYIEEDEKYKTGTELYFSTNLTGYQLYAYFLEEILL